VKKAQNILQNDPERAAGWNIEALAKAVVMMHQNSGSFEAVSRVFKQLQVEDKFPIRLGVRKYKGSWVAYAELNGERLSKRFSIEEVGEEVAYRKAVKEREKYEAMQTTARGIQPAKAFTSGGDEEYSVPVIQTAFPTSAKKPRIADPDQTAPDGSQTRPGIQFDGANWVASVYEKSQRVRRSFSLAKYGNDEAYQMAVDYRRKWERKRETTKLENEEDYSSPVTNGLGVEHTRDDPEPEDDDDEDVEIVGEEVPFKMEDVSPPAQDQSEITDANITE
jgi:hypothetical protein